MEERRIKPLEEAKRDAIELICNSDNFMVFTVNAKSNSKLAWINNPMSALILLKQIKIAEADILMPVTKDNISRPSGLDRQ